MISPRLKRTLLMIDSFLVMAVLYIMWFVYLDHPVVGAKRTIEIPTGASVSQIAVQLQDERIIESARIYQIFSWFSDTADHPRPGVYSLQPGTSYNAIAHLLALGPATSETQLRVIEGWDLDDISALLTNAQVSSTLVNASIGAQADRAPFDAKWRTEFSFLQNLPLKRSLEGYLFPDTYRVWQNQLPDGLIRKQLNEFAGKYGTTTVPSTLAPLKSLDDVVVLASVIEKEVRLPEERRRVAGIFLRRMRLGIPLQSDATLSYVTGSKRDRATADELELESPYNSYRHKGLPPSPICNPGATAIDAVLHPIFGKDLYFLTDSSGKVYYAATFEEHIRNRRLIGI